MLLKEIILENYGLYNGINKIAFPACTDGKVITLIGGLNGRGKTTLLEAVSFALYGKRAVKFLQDQRVNYTQFLKNHINKSALDKHASVTLTLLLGENNTDEVTIRRQWQETKSGVNDLFTVTKNDIEDQFLSDSWDYYVEDILPLGISRFFFFDNEKISQIADDESFEQMKESIEVLLGLTTIDQLCSDMKKLMKRKVDGLSTAEHSEVHQKLENLRLETEAAEKEMKLSVDAIGRLKRELGQAQKLYADLETEFWNHGGHLGLRRDEMSEESTKLTAQLNSYKEQLIQLADLPTTPLALCSQLLNRTFNAIQDGERVRATRYSSTIINQLEDMLSQTSKQDDERNMIRDFLVQARSMILNTKQESNSIDISPASQILLASLIDKIGQTKERTAQALLEARSLENQIAQLEMLLSFDIEGSDLAAIWEKLKDATQKIAQMDSILHVEEEKQRLIINRLESIESRKLGLLKQGQNDQMDYDETLRMVQYASITLDVMQEFKRRLQRKRIKELEQQIFDCFSFISQKQGMIQGINIHSETLDISLVDYNGGELLKSQLSAGEKQIFAVSILWGLAKCSGYDMPVIVDTPLGRLDSNHRSNFVRHYLPHASRQVVVLSTDEEIIGRHYEAISGYVNDSFLLVYDDKEKRTTISNGYFGGYGQ